MNTEENSSYYDFTKIKKNKNFKLLKKEKNWD